MIRTRVGLFLMILALAAPAQAQSLPGGAQDPYGPESWEKYVKDLKEDNFRDCGPRCLYEIGNQMISTEVLFNLYRLMETERRLHDSGNAGREDAIRQEAIPSPKLYCDGAPQRESWEDCYERYKRSEVMRFYELKKSLGNNEFQTYLLKAAGQTPTLQSSEDQTLKKTLYPYVTNMRDIEQAIDKDASNPDPTHDGIDKLSSVEYVEWANKQGQEPKLVDFPKFKEIPRDPSDPSNTDTVIVKDTTCGAAECYDTDAYGRALEIHTDRISKYTNDRQIAETRKQEFLDPPRRIISQPVKTDPEIAVGNIPRGTFNKARGSMVRQINTALGKSQPSPPPASTAAATAAAGHANTLSKHDQQSNDDEHDYVQKPANTKDKKGLYMRFIATEVNDIVKEDFQDTWEPGKIELKK